jgi:hypothetical protein
MKIFKATRHGCAQRWMFSKMTLHRQPGCLQTIRSRCRIELSELGPERDETRILRAMGWETANIHLGTRSAVKDVLHDLKERKANWLGRSAEKMVAVTLKDWEMWKTGNVS